MKIAVEGCCHGELDKIYETLQYLEQVNNIKVDLLLICGDFQAVRNKDDLESMAVPKKYQKLNTFYKYYSGEKVAPVLTIFIGGNHEASNYMQELPYGGWVAENIYYMGYANVIQVKGLRIGGLSGIYKSRDYNKGHYEHAPYSEDTKRSVYHIRSLEVFRLKQLSRPLDIFMSHDWPTDIAKYGQLSSLFKRKPFLEAEVRNGSLGSPPAAELLHKLQPSHWFAAHLHVKYAAVVQHSEGKCTKFLSLDKCLPRRRFLQVLDFPDKEDGPVKISLDPEWLCVLKTTNHLLNLNRVGVYMPGPGGADRYNFEVSEKDMEDIKKVFGDDMTLPENFETTAPTLKEREFKPHSPPVLVNPQTALLCTMLDVTDPNAVHLGITSYDTIAKSLQVNADDVDIDEDAVDTDDDAPSDVNSSLDTSYISSSMDMSDSFSDSQHKTLAMDFSANSSALSDEVNDDDEEFQAILAAQRQNSVQSGGTVEMDNDKLVLEKSASGSDSEVKTSLTSSSKTESSEDEFAATCPAQQHNSNRLTVESGNSDKAVGHTADAVDISCSDLDSASQDSQDETGRVQTLQPHQTAKTCHELSLPAEDSLNSPASKRSSPDVLSKVLTSSGKKIKRRNVSMYSSSGLEEDNG